MKNRDYTNEPLPLRPLEKTFKKFYTETGYCTTDKAISWDEFAKRIEGTRYDGILNDSAGLLARNLQENSYFQSKLNVSAIMHLRYLPAIYHSQEFFEVECVLSGAIDCFIGDQKILLKQGDVLILSPMVSHSASVYSDNGVMVNVLVRQSTFEESFLNLLPDNDLLRDFFVKALYKESNTPYLLFCTNSAGFLIERIVPILRESERNNRYKNTMLSSLLATFFVELLRNYEKDVTIPASEFSTPNENIIFILEYMQKNYDSITLSHLAEFFNYSERQMQRIIEKATGMTFVENIKRLRMSNAKEFLMNTDMTVSEIADRLGYYDASGFRQVFRKYYGVSPKEYRQRKENK